MGYFYKAIVQSILLYGAETWVISEKNMRKLRSFHRRCARFIVNRHITCKSDGTWTYPHSETVLEDAGLLKIEEYIQKRRDTIFDFVRNRQVYQKCKDFEVDKKHECYYWWKQSFSVEP